ncbi:dolichyl-phosphate-mannose--protein mannosyltransferase [uncultured Bacteroides sp.]|uniref:ArnT family glycosyltransferase n=1 Tax=uncultured Bacteroides sp. TaxID=162156 RepID=UPI002AAB392B|nr:dolichyl-phosphate-mannose--protein mannosyltransferase [uncultured Bacteroides sp.]
MKANKYFLLLLAFLPLLFLRDFTPDNELKYLSIADEAIRNGNFFTFTNHGLVYADKPPLYLWIVMLGKLLFGTHSMLFLGLFSVIPALVILYVMDKWIAGEADQKNRLSGQLMLITSGYFIGAGVVLRMDMLMCMFIVLSLYTFYQMYAGKGTKWSRFLFPFYVFMALFTKGPIGILVPLLSVVAFLAVKGELKTLGRYLGAKTWIILFAGSAIWFAGVFIEGGYDYLHNLLFNQTVNRAVDSFHHKKPFYFYFEVIWYCLAPWSLLYIGVLFAGIKAKLINTDLEKLFLTIITVTFVMLSLISSKVEVYMLPAFPFFAYLAVLLLQKGKQNKFVSALIAIPVTIIGLTFPAALVLGRFHSMAFLNNPVVYLLTGLLLVIAVFSLYYLYKQKNLNKSVNALAIGLLLVIFIGSFFIPSYNQYIGYGELCKEGKEIARQRGIDTFYFYNAGRMENIDSYLNHELKELKESDLNNMQCRKAILFVRTKDIERNPSLKKMVERKDKIIKGNCSIVIL